VSNTYVPVAPRSPRLSSGKRALNGVWLDRPHSQHSTERRWPSYASFGPFADTGENVSGDVLGSVI
jgi:hypothetical protein